VFDQRRIRLADIDGSGLVDILYLTGQGVQLYFNQSGNAWSERRILSTFPRIDNLSAVSTVDLLGNGTACLVWSSPLPGDARSTIRYIDLMGGQKPYLLIKTVNNLGGETEVTYAPSTKFYLQDKQAGTPWITKLPFPVHCVEKVTVRDQWRQTEFASTYSYHHGYFDGIEREFRGFGRVEQQDVERYGKFYQGNVASPYITDNHDLYQPPIKTITWYHTGAAIDRERILTQFANEYFPARYSSTFREKTLPEPELPDDLSADEWREALRACKGMVLRQESYELDVDALQADDPKDVPVRIYSAATHNCHIQRIQPRGENKHAVFLVTESEALSYHYELTLPKEPAQLSPDPRIVHTLNLRHDEYGNPQQSIAIAYGRVALGQNAHLPQAGLIDQVQTETHIVYTETRYTNDVILPEQVVGQTSPIKHYRLRLPYEIRTYEITGIPKPTGRYFNINDLRKYALCEDALYPPSVPGNQQINLTPLLYHQQPQTSGPHRRMVEHACTRYFDDGDDSTGAPKTPTDPLPLGQHGPRGLKYEDYKLALTNNLLGAVFDAKLTADVLAKLNTATISGYTPGTAISSSFIDQWWMCSGIAGFASDAAAHFYLPEEYTDPFGNKTTLKYDELDLFIQSSTDALGNTSGVAVVPAVTGKPRFDYRVLAPLEMVDANGNHAEVYFDILGMVVASAVKGKGNEGDDLIGFDDDLANPSAIAVQAFCTASVMNVQQARDWLGHATARFVYHFGGPTRPAGACGIMREIHVRGPGGADSPLQVALECSDGTGNVLMKKVQAEPDSTLPIADQKLRWIINGLTVLNNKGKPVKQYEPSFSKQGFGCEPPPVEGVTPIIYYDAAGRVVRTEMPNGTFSRVEFSHWHVKTFDPNDTVLESRWYSDRNPLPRDQPLPRDPITGEITATPDQRAAWLAAQHANTPAQVHLDSLGREVIAIAHNSTNGVDELYLTFTKLDAEGKPLWIRDARGNLVMQYITPAKANNDVSNAMPANAVPCYDIAGNLLFQHSMDSGDRWMLMDAAGKPMLAWDLNETPQGTTATRENRFYRTDYDALHRPTALWLTINANVPIMIERYEYQDAVTPDVHNLNGQLIRHYDSSGLVEAIRRDFKGNVREVRRILVKDATASIVDWQGNLASKLEIETYAQLTEHDALNRMTRQENWHKLGGVGAVYTPIYNERGALKSETFTLNGTATNAIEDIRYNAKGQKEYLELGNGTLTQYDYDPKTFRLTQIRTTRPVDASDFPDRHSNLQDIGIIQQLRYTYDPVGNISEIYDEAYEPVFFRNQQVEPRSRYAYDALYRLTEAEGREGFNPSHAPTHREEGPQEVEPFPLTDQTLRNYIQRYTYDAVGNILHMQHFADQGNWHRRYAYATDSNRLLRTWEGNDDWDNSQATNKTEYDHDTHGSMLNLANVAPGQQLQWDHRDMIKSLDLVGGGIAHYQYDSDKQRTRKVIVNRSGVKQWERIYLGGYELYRRIVAGAVVEEIESHHLFEGEQRVLLVDDVITASGMANPRPDGLSVKKQTLFRYQYSNHLGSACLELDHEAEVISYEEYHPYGTSAYRAMKSGIEAPPKRYRYAGMEVDDETSLSYQSARYFSLQLGRWASADAANLADGTNLYRYVSCNPVRFVDRNGFFQGSPALIAGSAAGEGAALGGGAAAGGAAATAIVAGAALVALAAVAFAVYENSQAISSYQELSKARERSDDLQKQVRKGKEDLDKQVEQSWRDGYLTDEEYEIYKLSAELPKGYFTSLKDKRVGFYATPSEHRGKPLWLQKMLEGIYFNKLMAFSYQYRELYVENAKSKSGYSILDFYIPGREIGSRKNTQFSDISVDTGIGYLRELVDKYPRGAVVADVPSSGLQTGGAPVEESFAGHKLSGKYVLEVPRQIEPIPLEVLKEAERLGIEIRDVYGNIYKTPKAPDQKPANPTDVNAKKTTSEQSPPVGPLQNK